MIFVGFETRRGRLLCRNPECLAVLRSGRRKYADFIENCIRKPGWDYCCSQCGMRLIYNQ
jgi:hypothetical protein